MIFKLYKINPFLTTLKPKLFIYNQQFILNSTYSNSLSRHSFCKCLFFSTTFNGKNEDLDVDDENFSPDSSLSNLFKYVSSLTPNSAHFQLVNMGIVTEVKDGVITVSGLKNVGYGDLIIFENNMSGIALSLEPNNLKVMVLGDDFDIKPGHAAALDETGPTIPIKSALLGHIIDPFGNILDDTEVVEDPSEPVYYPTIEFKAPGIVTREKVSEPVYTGIKIVDSTLPIGRGQRELIIGDRQTGKTSIAIDAIISQKQNVYNYYDAIFCIYVAIGQKRASVLNVFQKLIEHNAMNYTIIIAATASESASLQYLAPYAGATVGEFFRNLGRHSLIVYDDLTKHAIAYRQISLLLRRPPGREAYPGDVFYLHSRLLERAAKIVEIFGGGSITALPIIETQGGDVSAYIPTNVISITDGQIFLETSLFYKGIRPAINVGLSVSRVGAAAQDKPVKQVANSLKLELAQFREVENFTTFGSDLDDITKRILFRGFRLIELLKQSQYNPYNIDHQLVLIHAGLKGYFDNLSLSQINIFESRILSKPIPYLLSVRGQNR
jgi:F-type H+-transporting ATPase subunit alpha